MDEINLKFSLKVWQFETIWLWNSALLNDFENLRSSDEETIVRVHYLSLEDLGKEGSDDW